MLSKVSVFCTLQHSERLLLCKEWHLEQGIAKLLLSNSKRSFLGSMHRKVASRQWLRSQWWWQSIWMRSCQYFWTNTITYHYYVWNNYRLTCSCIGPDIFPEQWWSWWKHYNWKQHCPKTKSLIQKHCVHELQWKKLHCK